MGTTVREAEPSELALLFESVKQEIKKPKLELLLVDGKGNAGREIHAQPTYIRVKRVKGTPPIPYINALSELTRKMESVIYPFGKKEPSKDLVPIGIEISNIGEAPAHGIRILLKFPEDCELIPEDVAVEGFPVLSKYLSKYKPSSGGLFVDSEDRSEAWAWIDNLGNDLMMRKFEKVYVRFPEKEQQYIIKARIIQHNFPPENFEFVINVKPNVEEKVEYISEEQPEEKEQQ